MVEAPVLFDTNILVDYLNGIEMARDEIERHAGRAISSISWMEVMAGASSQDELEVRAFLSSFVLLAITPVVAEAAVVLRRQRRLKLPDAIILATAQVAGRILITRNTRDFGEDDPDMRVPYRL